MKTFIIKHKLSCLFFAEGRRDKDFLYALIELPQFKYYSSKWEIYTDNASGSSPRDILDQCVKKTQGTEYNLVICFIDLDKLKSDYKKTWVSERKRLETEYSKIKIIWQEDNAEEEYKRVLGQYFKKSNSLGKFRINQLAKENVKSFINSDYWNKIKKTILLREEEL